MSHAGRLVLRLAALALAGACVSGDSVGPPQVDIDEAVGGLPLHLYDAYDDCIHDATRFCHGTPVLLEYYAIFSGGGSANGEEYSCPDGCSTWDLSPALKNLVQYAIGNRIRVDSQCGWARSTLNQSLNYGRIRWYNIYDPPAGGDVHMPWWPTPINSDIHVRQDHFANSWDLAWVLLHEAAHIAFNLQPGQNGIETQAEADRQADIWAATCII